MIATPLEYMVGKWCGTKLLQHELALSVIFLELSVVRNNNIDDFEERDLERRLCKRDFAHK